tara:strand:- start:153 stop:1649 length:1497 start_codon:yes stop_codon:yes gene_type:complete
MHVGTTKASGQLQLQSANGTTGITLDASSNATFAGQVKIDTTERYITKWESTYGTDRDYWWRNDNGLLQLGEGSEGDSNVAFTFNTASNMLGVGTTAPAQAITIKHSEPTILFIHDSTEIGFIGDCANFLTGSSPGSDSFGVRSTGDFRIGTGGNNLRMTVQSDGKVGINCTPAEMFSVDGDTKLDGKLGIGKSPQSGYMIDAETTTNVNLRLRATNSNAGSRIHMMSGASDSTYIQFYDEDSTVLSSIFTYGSSASPSKSLQFNTGGTTQALLLDSSQNATFAGSIYLPNDTGLHMGQSNSSGYHFIGNNPNTHDLMIESGGDDIDIVGSWLRIRQSASGGVTTAFHTQGHLNVGGDAQTTFAAKFDGIGGSDIFIGDNCSANSFTTRSDERLKKYIKDIPYGEDFINKLRPVEFQWKQEATKDGKRAMDTSKKQFGLIAQEVKKVIDEVGVDFDGYRFSISDDKEEVMGLEYTQFVAPLIKAVQELSAKVKALENA